MHTHVVPALDADKLAGRVGSLRDHDLSVRRVEAIAEGKLKWSVLHARGGYLHALIFHYKAVVAQFVSVHERLQRNAALVADARRDIRRTHFKEKSGHRFQRRRSPSVEARA